MIACLKAGRAYVPVDITFPKERLMIPRKIIILQMFPLNTNGKIDRKKLMENM